MLQNTKILLRIFIYWLALVAIITNATEHKLPTLEKHLKLSNRDINLTDYQQEALNYLAETEDSSWAIKESCTNEKTGMTTVSLQIKSITWPKKNNLITSDHPEWVHRVNIYIPKKINTDTTLLHIGNGLLYPTEKYQDKPSSLDFAKIAQDTNSVVIEVRDIPNQFLSFTEKQGDNLIEISGKKEDDLFMYTWGKYLSDPKEYYYMPLHIAMAKATIRTMTACQDFLLESNNISIKNFVLSGASKRGWAAWLVAAFDSRVNAIIPVVCDFLDLNKLIENMQKQENSKYITAGMLNFFKPYLKTPRMQKLINLVDPIGYQQFINMPKYIISSVCDKFVPPETNQGYLDNIANKNLRMFHDTGHYFVQNHSELLASSIQSFYGAFLLGKKIPEITYSFDGENIKVVSTATPKAITLYTLNSKDDSFIDACLVDANSFAIKTEKGINKYEVPVNTKATSTQLHMLELHFNNMPFDDLIITTPTFKHSPTQD